VKLTRPTIDPNNQLPKGRELVELVKREEPRLIPFSVFFNEDVTEVSVVQVHPDADSMLSVNDSSDRAGA
jgi:hypothetical protein